MFKKLKDKLAEEVKSSPQRIQQFAQAAQAAVTSASSSISDITNNDLFSIGDNDSSQNSDRTSNLAARPPEPNTFQDVSLMQPKSLQASAGELDYGSRHDQAEGQHLRRLSNSSFASDVSFRLPSYESPSLYHLQSDMEVSASEAEERGFSGGAASLDRVTKEQLYAAYKRTQQRYEKYRTQYADLARHYKFLERDNAKARSVLVETQDKALRRISELREQCTLEQSAKAHLEKALRMEIDERNMKIEALNTKINVLQDSSEHNTNKEDSTLKTKEADYQLIDLSGANEKKSSDDGVDSALNNKTEKLEQLLNKYKESLKTSKEKNAQTAAEIHRLTGEIENKNKEIEQLKSSTMHLTEARKKILELHEINEELQNKVNTYEFNKTKEKSALEIDLQKAAEEIEQLRSKIEVFNKREEEYAISLAENKLSIHKELESKEAEIKSLKQNLTASKNEVQSLNIVVSDYKKSITALESDKTKLNNDVNELNTLRSKIVEKEAQIKDLALKCKSLEQSKIKADEEYKCLQLQTKQETAEKLAMIDRNTYLETKNAQLSEENTKKGLQVTELESQLINLKKNNEESHARNADEVLSNRNKMLEDIESWKNKYYTMESEIQEEREELAKLQTEIEKLIENQEVIQTRNSQLQITVTELTEENAKLLEKVNKYNKIKMSCQDITANIKSLEEIIALTSKEANILKANHADMVIQLKNKINELSSTAQVSNFDNIEADFEKTKNDLNVSQAELIDIKQQLNLAHNKLATNEEENKYLKEQIQLALSENTIKMNKLMDVEKECELKTNEFRIKESDLTAKIDELESLNQALQTTVTNIRGENLSSNAKLEDIEKEKQNMMEKIKQAEINNTQLLSTIEELEKLKLEKAELTDKVNDIEEKKANIKKLEEKIKVLTQENVSLKDQSQSITSNLAKLETEISDIRKSHAEIEGEKDRLNYVIKMLEDNEETEKNKQSIDVQTDESILAIDTIYEDNKILKEKCEQFKQEKESLFERFLSVEKEKENLLSEMESRSLNCSQFENEIKSLKQTNSDLFNEISLNKNVRSDLDQTIKTSIELQEKYSATKNDYDLLKEENRRLSSDIEGLQTYLAKISKENSTLNDKLRELIASSENIDKNENISTNFAEHQPNDVHTDNDKLNDLLRENMLLVEENLELKDQLRSQNYSDQSNVPTKGLLENESELDILKEKYNSLMATKNKYEKQLSDMEHINRSVNGNMQSVQENNEKLRLSNEKLERRLDEALVSLRHLHSLQENTELEYLRNILYEYLTGSGTHSITLAKVLAAIVKFDEMQTNNVLQKEKERQGLLRQLGLL